MSAGNLTAIPGDADKLAGDIEKLKRSLPHLIELNRLLAAQRRALYDAYITNGFQPSEALELLKAEVARP